MKMALDPSVNNDSGFPMEDSVNNNSERNRKSHVGWKQKSASKIKGAFTVKLLRRRFPIVNWLPTYNWKFAINDLIAGITVSLITIPQGIAYAAVAGLPLQYGLYASVMGVFAYVVLGTVPESCVGPTAVTSLMTFAHASRGGPAYATLLAFLCGLVELIAGLLNLGFMVEFISVPVISGFCSAAALIVISTQIKGLFGLQFKGASVIQVLQGFFTHIKECNPWDSALGCSIIVLLLLMRKLGVLKNLGPMKKIKFLRNRFVDTSIWFISTSRNAIVVVAGCIAAYILEVNGSTPFTLTGNIKAGLPPFELPTFSINRTEANTTVVLGFADICSEFGAAIGLIPLISILEQVAVAKAFANGKRTDATQEMIALGVGTFLGSFIGSMPITSSFGRSAVQSTSGAKTPFANVYAGAVVLLALVFLMPSLAYIPKTILSAVIITSVIFMVELEEIKPMWKTNKVELLPLAVTFFCCLLINMEYGILIGTGFHLLMLTYIGTRTHPKLTRLPLTGSEVNEDKVIVKADINLYFPAVEKFRNALNKATLVNAEGQHSVLVIDLANLSAIDYSSLKMLESVSEECHKRGKTVLQFVNVTPKIANSIAYILPTATILPAMEEKPTEEILQIQETLA